MGINVSVLLRCYNQEDYIGPILQAYNQQTYPKELFEIVFADDGSSDSSVQIFENSQFDFNKKLVYASHAGRVSIVNKAFKECAGDIIIFCDGDCIPSPDFIEQHVCYHKKYDNIAVNGWTSIVKTIVFDEGGLDKASSSIEYYINNKIDAYSTIFPYKVFEMVPNHIDFALLNSLVEHKRNSRFAEILERYGETLDSCAVPWAIFHGANFSAAKSALEAAMPIPEKFNLSFDDWYISLKLHFQGVKIINGSAAVNYHQDHPRDKLKMKSANHLAWTYLFEEFPIFEVYCIDAYYKKQYSFFELNEVSKLYKMYRENSDGKALFEKIDEIINIASKNLRPITSEQNV